MNIQNTISQAVAVPLIFFNATNLTVPVDTINVQESRYAIAAENRYLTVHSDALSQDIVLPADSNASSTTKLAKSTNGDQRVAAKREPQSQFPAVILQVKVPSITQAPKPMIAEAQPVPASEYDALFAKYGKIYNVNIDIMKHIAKCESGFRPEAVNGSFGGMFQFMSSTWSSNRRAMGEDPNPELRFNAEEAIKTAAFKMSRDGFGAWPACSKKALAFVNI